MLARFLTFLLLLTMLAPAGSLGSVLYQCRLDGQVRESCCCRDADSEPMLSAISGEQGACCNLKVAKERQSAAIHERSALQIEISQPVGLPSAVTQSPPPETPHNARFYRTRYHPPSSGPPVYLRTCSFLI
jgi:hypothetical protein